jgi:hypothetical protein
MSALADGIHSNCIEEEITMGSFKPIPRDRYDSRRNDHQGSYDRNRRYGRYGRYGR